MPGKVILIRHGEVAQDKPPERVRGQSNPRLDREGLKEAQQITKRVAPLQPTTIFTSDLARAKQTAEIIAKPLRANVVPLAGLRAWDLGTFTGQIKSKVQGRIKYYVDHPKETVPGGESYLAFARRVQISMSHIAAGARVHGATVAVVIHDSVFRVLYALAGKLTKGEPVEPGDQVVVAV